jgi:hypothetical protein
MRFSEAGEAKILAAEVHEAGEAKWRLAATGKRHIEFSQRMQSFGKSAYDHGEIQLCAASVSAKP